MRLTAWNCYQKFSTNVAHVLELDPDLAVISESQPLDAWPLHPRGRGLTHVIRTPYAGSPKHLTVLAAEPWAVREHPEADGAPSTTLPVLVDGPHPLLLVGVWTVLVEGVAASYEEQIDQLLRWLDKHAADLPVVVAGDFNSPISTSLAAWRVLVTQFEHCGLVDAFQVARPGLEDDHPTYFHRWKSDDPFHIDHVFIPSAWAERATVEVGAHADWVATGRSDHVPVTVEIPTLRRD